jgi:hypothetical protein
MFNDLRETVKSFTHRGLINSNVMSTGTTFQSLGGARHGMLSGARNNSPSSMMVSSKFLATYYIRSQEIRDYEVTELTNTVVGIFRDYIVNYFNKENDIITLKGASVGNELYEHQKRINWYFEQLGLVEEIKSHLFEIIYNGQYCIKIDWNKENRNFIKYNLQNPYNVVSVIKGGKIDHHLVLSRDGQIKPYAPNAIIRFGKAELHLINDMNANFYPTEKNDTIISPYKLVAGQPLYYNLGSKLKEFLLKDQVVSLLSIKDLIQPLLLLVRVDKSTSPEEANRLALNTENLINKYSDISSILGAKFSINDLIDSLINNIRVLPDYASALGDMNSIDLTKITNKIAEIRNDQEQSKENILVSLGIPRALFAGEVSKWEAIKASERLNSKVNSYINQISDGLIYTASMFYYMMTRKEFKVENIECNLFTKTPVDYNTSAANAEVISNLMATVNTILDGAQQLISNNKLIGIDGYYNYAMSQLKAIDPDILGFVGEKQLKLLIDDMAKMKQMQSQEGGM